MEIYGNDVLVREKRIDNTNNMVFITRNISIFMAHVLSFINITKLKRWTKIILSTITLALTVLFCGNMAMDRLDQKDFEILDLKLANIEIRESIKPINYKDIAIDWAIKNSDADIPISTIKQIVEETMKYDDWKILLSIISIESGFNHLKKSYKGAHGLTQIRYFVWKKELNIKNLRQLYDISNNIKYGRYVLNKYLVNADGNIKEALNRYVGGDSEYSKKVLSQYADLEFMIDKSHKAANREIIGQVGNSLYYLNEG